MRKNKRLRSLITLTVFLLAVFLLSACGSKDALHISYRDDADSPYGSGNYLYSTVTFNGSALGREKVLSVSQLEKKVSSEKLGYSGKYSMLTRGSIFTKHKYTGLRLYRLLIDQGMKKDIAGNTRIVVKSTDGYTKVLTVDELRHSDGGYYSSISSPKAKKDGLPILLTFGSDGKPLVGPTGAQNVGTRMTKAQGYVDDAENDGGPVKLTIGQTAADDYNAPENSKWVDEVTVGEDVSYTSHPAGTGGGLTISVFDADANNRLMQRVRCGVRAVEKLSAENAEYAEDNYYGRHYYQGAGIWDVISKEVKLSNAEGKVLFRYDDGSSQTVDMSYLRNMKNEDDKYYCIKGGKKITAVMPALAYAVDGSPTKDGALYACLPARKGVSKGTSAKICQSIEIYSGGPQDINKNANRKLTIKGAGTDRETAYSVAELENMPDLIRKDGSYSGVSLYDLLEDNGLTVDAGSAVLSNGSGKTVKLDIARLRSGNFILATRRDGRGLSGKEGYLCLRGDRELADVRTIRVDIKKGQWTHAKGAYRKYLDSKVKISGSAVNERTYTLRELEAMKKMTVRDSFAASEGEYGFQGVILRKLIAANLKDDVRKVTRITAIGKDGFRREVPLEDVYQGIDSSYQPGEHRDVILAYSINGQPLVKGRGVNGYGPLRLIVENKVSYWVKDLVEIRVDK
ncbi:MAG: molybdopterin-dependent oxidoreductase [Anaerovoracaceae bacterium]|jgi:DMSO/TMAO reductase YedYZ molybdopterin-dependent catalytic subunit